MSKLDDFFKSIDELRILEPSYFQPKLYGTKEVNKSRFSLESFLQKTPAALVEEGCQAVYQTKLDWIMTAENVIGNETQFEMTGKMMSIVAKGVGSNKKQAKHRAAIDFLYKVVENGRHKEFLIPGDTEEEAKANIAKLIEPSAMLPEQKSSSAVEEKTVGPISATSIPPEEANKNWVGDVQELCQKNKISVNYEFTEEGVNEKIFIAQCTVNKLVTEGRAKTKKTAKTISAYLMSKKLRDDLESMDRDALDESPDVLPGAEKSQVDVEKTDAVISTPTDYEAALRSILSDTTKFASFDLDYSFLTSKSTNDTTQCILCAKLELTPLPVEENEFSKSEESVREKEKKERRERRREEDSAEIVFGGEGMDEKLARQDASRSALLHILTI